MPTSPLNLIEILGVYYCFDQLGFLDRYYTHLLIRSRNESEYRAFIPVDESATFTLYFSFSLACRSVEKDKKRATTGRYSARYLRSCIKAPPYVALKSTRVCVGSGNAHIETLRPTESIKRLIAQDRDS